MMALHTERDLMTETNVLRPRAKQSCRSRHVAARSSIGLANLSILSKQTFVKST